MRNHPDGKITGRQERMVGILILCTLAVIAAGIYHVQHHIHPAVFPLSPGDAAPPGIGSIRDAPVLGTLFPVPPGTAPAGPVESFDSATLSDKINGKAELYLSAGFVGLQTQRFELRADDGLWAEIYVYDMGGFRNAFSVYSAQRRGGASPLSITPEAYITANAAYLAHGDHYVEIIASDAVEHTDGMLRQLAGAFVGFAGASAQEIPERSLFPAENRIPGTVNLISANGFGFERLDRLFTARYRVGETEITLFLSRRRSPREAQALARAYGDFLLAFGGKEAEGATNAEPAVRRIEIMGVHELIATSDSYVAGVHEAEEIPAAQRMLRMLIAQLRESAHVP